MNILKQLNITKEEKNFLNAFWNDSELLIIEKYCKDSNARKFIDSTINYYSINHNTKDLNAILLLKKRYI